MAKKEHLIQTTVNKKTHEFYKSLSNKEGTISSWVRESLIDFAKKYKWNTTKVIKDYETK